MTPYLLAACALAGGTVLAGCADQPDKPPVLATTTSLPAAPAADDDHTIFSGSVFSATGVIPGVQKSCKVTGQDGSVYDAEAEVMLWTLKPDGDTDQVVALSSLGIGWLLPNGSCEFRLNLEFPTPATPPSNDQNLWMSLGEAA